ncbi:MAG: MBL fold metallo-hydrolase [Burkholderiaceae bacterium]|nr:MBL fold metallo-hydrolase [Burkholderiaceae bacterium]
MRFSNLKGHFRQPAAAAALKWMLGWHDEKQPKTPASGVPVPFVQNDGAALRGSTDNTLTWIGHASFLLQLGGINVLIDPVLSPALGWYRRNMPPGLDWPALPKIDFVLITHNHRDHMDAPTLKRLGPEPVYIVPQGLRSWFKRAGMQRIVEMAWWQQLDIDGLNITFVPAEHWTRRGLSDTNTSWWGGYVIERGGLRVYHSGDSGWFDGFSMIGERCGDIQAAMLPIGAYAPRWFMRSQHINPDEAVRAFQAVKAQRFIAMHWGTFKLSDEPLDEPPKILRAAWEQAQLPDNQLHIPAIGETLLLDKMR